MPPDFRPSCIRITPACAGKTNKKNPGFRQNPDHPRVCGENDRERILCEPHIGSPPRVRGKPRGRTLPVVQTRITPACAGKTAKGAAGSRFQADHPRVCGENSMASVPPICDAGSPPRVRGKHNCRDLLFLRPRITPACAGKTLAAHHIDCIHPDHPRVCGENLKSCKVPFVVHGSPPRVRGKLQFLSECHVLLRITPACAGKTFCRAPRCFPRADHPRVCGENQNTCSSL